MDLKKVLVVGFGLVVAGTFAASFAGGDSEEVITKNESKVGTPILSASKVTVPKQCEDKRAPKEIEEKQQIIGYTDFCKPMFSKNSYQITEGKSEYTSLKSFVNDMIKNWEKGSDYRSVYADKQSADYQLAYASLHYINYFKNEISKKGMTKIFEKLQNAAYTIVNETGGGDKAKMAEATTQFGKSLREIYLNI